MTLTELIARRDRLRRARFNGAATVRIDGEEVTYKTDAQIASAMAALETEIAKIKTGSDSLKSLKKAIRNNWTQSKNLEALKETRDKNLRQYEIKKEELRLKGFGVQPNGGGGLNIFKNSK